ncbi:DUF6207 family protein [Streptomyces sp. NPDC006785]|uniref:DUF6207 family protein n=1 Tax=Streptomyces sp. NPDC006785 TaxID=3155461 RepID=UPI0033F503E5
MAIEINAADRHTVEVAVEQIAGLWLSSTTPVRPVPGQGFRARVHADLTRSPGEGGIPDEAEAAGASG